MLVMTKADYEKILGHCKKGLPNESCGLIGGVVEDGKRYIKKVYLLTNIDASNEHFSMDPKEQMDTSCLATSILIRNPHHARPRRTSVWHMIPR